MNVGTSVTETVVQNHLQAFLQQKGIPAIVDDYDDDARLFTEARIYRGKHEIHGKIVLQSFAMHAGAGS
jgi:hypothetical protein